MVDSAREAAVRSEPSAESGMDVSKQGRCRGFRSSSGSGASQAAGRFSSKARQLRRCFFFTFFFFLSVLFVENKQSEREIKPTHRVKFQEEKRLRAKCIPSPSI